MDFVYSASQNAWLTVPFALSALVSAVFALVFVFGSGKLTKEQKKQAKALIISTATVLGLLLTLVLVSALADKGRRKVFGGNASAQGDDASPT